MRGWSTASGQGTGLARKPHAAHAAAAAATGGTNEGHLPWHRRQGQPHASIQGRGSKLRRQRQQLVEPPRMLSVYARVHGVLLWQAPHRSPPQPAARQRTTAAGGAALKDLQPAVVRRRQVVQQPWPLGPRHPHAGGWRDCALGSATTTAHRAKQAAQGTQAASIHSRLCAPMCACTMCPQTQQPCMPEQLARVGANPRPLRKAVCSRARNATMLARCPLAPARRRPKARASCSGPCGAPGLTQPHAVMQRDTLAWCCRAPARLDPMALA